MLNFSSGTHVGYKLPESYPELIRKFIKLNEDPRWDNNFGLSHIAKMNETPLLMNIPYSKIILKLDQKKLLSKTMGKKGFS